MKARFISNIKRALILGCKHIGDLLGNYRPITFASITLYLSRIRHSNIRNFSKLLPKNDWRGHRITVRIFSPIYCFYIYFNNIRSFLIFTVFWRTQSEIASLWLWIWSSVKEHLLLLILYICPFYYQLLSIFTVIRKFAMSCFIMSFLILSRTK